MKRIPVSVIIPVCDDWKIFNCLDSIDEKVETIVILNGDYDKNIEKALKKTNVSILKMKKFSFSKFYNLGIKKSSYNRIFFMDSDREFKKEALKRLYEESKRYSIVKGKEEFSHNSIFSKITSKAREFTNSDKPDLYIPGIMFRKNIFKKVGLFNEYIKHSADAEMRDRINEKKIKWSYVLEAKIIHSPIKINEDLKSAFKYGTGRSQKHKIKNKKMPNFPKEAYFYFIEGTKRKNIIVGIYLLIWYFFFAVGYIKNNFIDIKWN